jgi:5,10-methylenetetrahydromethanopterin reductase
MRIGLFISEASPPGSTIEATIERARWADEQGLHTGWVPHVPWSLDALTALALVGPATTRMELGTAVVPTWSHHPYAMAQHALTAQAACRGRLLLGIGPSHQMVAEGWYGADYSGVIHHVREYVEVLEEANAAQVEALQGRGAGGMGGPVRHEGERYPVQSLLGVPGGEPVPIYLAALAPLMLRLAGERAEGTITWMCDEAAVEGHVAPRLAAAAQGVGRPMPRIIAGLPVAVCADRDVGLASAERRYGTYKDIPTYARALARGESSTPGEVAAVGTEEQVAGRLRSYADAGVSDLAAMTWGVGDDEAERRANHDRTLALLAELARSA